MVELGAPEEAGTEELAMASNKSPLPMKETSPNYNFYSPPLAKYEDVVASPALFRSTLEKLHASMRTKFMVPTVGGKELDLHRLFVEVTSRGGIDKIIRERRWAEVTAVFNFPPTATNASFVLRKYYASLLGHYEQIYFFRARADSPQSSCMSQPITQASPGCGVFGVIDGKFESGYLVTVTVGTQTLKGVLYGAPPIQQHDNDNDNDNATGGVHQRRRRRKKSEIKRRDPNHPKPNRSGYNFFFAEQHGRLKPLHPGKDREISRMIGELWNKLNDSDRTVYQEKAVKDKERYKLEMIHYREKLQADQVVSDAVPLQQRFPGPDLSMAEAQGITKQVEDHKAMEKDFDMEAFPEESSDEVHDLGDHKASEEGENELAGKKEQPLIGGGGGY